MAETEIKSINGRTICDNQARQEIDNHIKNDLDWFGNGASIPESADLDTYLTIGKYFCSSNSRAQSLINCPATSNFCMLVFNRTGANYLSQLIVELNGKMHARSKDSSSWRGWITFTTSAELVSLTTKVDTLSEEIANHIVNDLDWFGKGTSIPDNADLDTYQTTGKFYCLSDARAKTLDNCPTTTNFCLFVFYRADYMSQLIVAGTGKLYVRSRDSSKWREWAAYPTSAEIEVLIDSVKEELLEEVDDLSKELTEYINNDLSWFDKGNVLLDNDDLDNYQAVGKFYCPTESKARTLKNCPTTTNFSMWVFDRTGGYKSQLIINLNGKLFIRSRDSSKWREWAVYTTSDEIAELITAVKEELLAETSAQSDWEQVDETKADYIKNKPFGTAIKYTTVCDKLIFAQYDYDFNITYASSSYMGWTPSVGERYLVSLDDGIGYELTVDDQYHMSSDSAPISLELQDDQFLIYVESPNSYQLSIKRMDEELVKIDKKYLPDDIFARVELFYSATCEEHLWIDVEATLYFDLSTPIVVGEKYKVNIDGTEYTVTATEDTFMYEYATYDAVKLSSGDDCRIWYVEGFKDSTGYNALYFPSDSYMDSDYNLIPHSLKIEQEGKSLKEIAESTIELDITYDDGTTGTLVLFGEVKP